MYVYFLCVSRTIPTSRWPTASLFVLSWKTEWLQVYKWTPRVLRVLWQPIINEIPAKRDGPSKKSWKRCHVEIFCYSIFFIHWETFSLEYMRYGPLRGSLLRWFEYRRRSSRPTRPSRRCKATKKTWICFSQGSLLPFRKNCREIWCITHVILSWYHLMLNLTQNVPLKWTLECRVFDVSDHWW